MNDLKYNIGLIYCLLDRTWKICSDKKDRELEVKKLKVTLAKNDYPSEIIRKKTEKFLKNRMNKNTEAPQVQANNKAAKYLILPHVNNKVIDKICCHVVHILHHLNILF